MIGYFPKEYPDELFQSLEGRFHYHTSSTSSSKTKLLLFGRPEGNSSLYFPTRLSLFIKNTCQVLSYDTEHIINRQTLWPYFRHFVKKANHVHALEFMKNGDGSKIGSLLGINGSGFSLQSIPKYCPICNLESLKKNGEFYFRRAHQIPHIIVCSTHNCFLEDYYHQDGIIPKSPIFVPSKQTCPKNEPRVNSNEKLYATSKYMVQVLEGKISLDFDYRNCAIRQGYNYGAGRMINQSRLQSDAVGFFGEDTLKCFFEDNGLKNQRFITNILINRSDKILNPTRHVLLQYFFSAIKDLGTIEENDFRESIEVANQFCLNPICPGYQTRPIRHFRRPGDKSIKAAVGKYKCSCGMTYRRNLKADDGRKMQLFLIREYGHLWDSTFSNEYRLNLPPKDLAVRFNIPISKVEYHAGRLSLLAGRAKPYPRTSIDISIRKLNSMRKTFMKHRATLGEPLTRNRRKIRNTLIWLARYDQAWLTANRFPKIVRNQNSLRNLEEVDEQCLEKLKLGAERLFNENRPRRITKSLILRSANVKMRHLNLPKCIEFLQDSEESIEDCQIRRLWMTAKKLKETNEKITVSRLMFDAHIWKRTKKLIEIAELIVAS